MIPSDSSVNYRVLTSSNGKPLKLMPFIAAILPAVGSVSPSHTVDKGSWTRHLHYHASNLLCEGWQNYTPATVQSIMQSAPRNIASHFNAP